MLTSSEVTIVRAAKTPGLIQTVMCGMGAIGFLRIPATPETLHHLLSVDLIWDGPFLQGIKTLEVLEDLVVLVWVIPFASND